MSFNLYQSKVAHNLHLGGMDDGPRHLGHSDKASAPRAGPPSSLTHPPCSSSLCRPFVRKAPRKAAGYLRPVMAPEVAHKLPQRCHE